MSKQRKIDPAISAHFRELQNKRWKKLKEEILSKAKKVEETKEISK